jgi:AcrR family transcriptional regulator
MGPRSQQRAATRERILGTAQDLFAARGFDGTSIPAILEGTGLSRGALYHHFASKEELFAAVLEGVEASIAARLLRASRAAATAEEAVVSGCVAFLRLASDPVVAQIVLVDAPVVIGWQRWRDLDERYAFGLLKTGIAAALGEHDDTTEMRAHVLLASLLELALVISRSGHPKAIIQQAAEETISSLVACLLSVHS